MQIQRWPRSISKLLSQGKLPSGASLSQREGTHRGAAAGVEEEVGSVGCSRRLVGDRPVAKGHAHDCSHVSLRAEDMDGDPSGLPCVCIREQSALGEGKGTIGASGKINHLTVKRLSRKQVEETRCKNETWKVADPYQLLPSHVSLPGSSGLLFAQRSSPHALSEDPDNP